jgi:hypothetical protein
VSDALGVFPEPGKRGLVVFPDGVVRRKQAVLLAGVANTGSSVGGVTFSTGPPARVTAPRQAWPADVLLYIRQEVRAKEVHHQMRSWVQRGMCSWVHPQAGPSLAAEDCDPGLGQHRRRLPVRRAGVRLRRGLQAARRVQHDWGGPRRTPLIGPLALPRPRGALRHRRCGNGCAGVIDGPITRVVGGPTLACSLGVCYDRSSSNGGSSNHAYAVSTPHVRQARGRRLALLGHTHTPGLTGRRDVGAVI